MDETNSSGAAGATDAATTGTATTGTATTGTAATGTAATGTTATPAASTAPAAEGTAGIVAIDSNEHAEAKTLFQRLRDSVSQGVEDLEADFEKLKTLLHL